MLADAIAIAAGLRLMDARDLRGLIPPDARASAAWVDRGVLVYGPRKAGTTLFQNLLDGSGQLLVYPAELKLKYFARKLSMTRTAAAFRERASNMRFTSGAFSFETYDGLWARAGADGARRPIGDLMRFDAWCVACSIIPPPAAPTLWCAKEVGGGRRDILAFWRGLFPGAKALFIVRAPLAVTRAVLNTRRRTGDRLPVTKIVHETLEPLRVLRRQAGYLDDPSVHFTVYEDLVTDPEREMRKVAAFLGIAWSPLLSRPTLFGETVVVRTASQATTEIFRPVGSWREGLTGREQRIVGATMAAVRRIPGMEVDYAALRARIAAREASSAAP